MKMMKRVSFLLAFLLVFNIFAPIQDNGVIDSHASEDFTGYKIEGGKTHTLMLKADGTVWSWGDGIKGQLGHGNKNCLDTPVQVVGLESIVKISTHHEHNLALKSDGTVWAWGNNDHGEVGDGTTTDRDLPVMLTLPVNEKVIDIDAGYNHSVAITDKGTLLAWGYNNSYQLGDGKTETKKSPTMIGVYSGAERVLAGIHHSILITNNNEIYTWGKNTYNQLGNGNSTTVMVPTLIDTSMLDGKVLDIETGYYHTILCTEHGSLYSWGYNEHGELGNGSIGNNIASPTKLHTASNVKNVMTTGFTNSIIVNNNGSDEVWAWGYNASGQIGSGDKTSSSSPIKVELENDVITAGVGYSFAMAIDVNGYFIGWGNNTYGQLGDGKAYQKTPKLNDNISNVTSIASGYAHNLAIDNLNKVYVWGDNAYGQAGGTTDVIIPTVLDITNDALSVGASNYSSYLIDTTNNVFSWGYNGYGNLGLGYKSTKSSFDQIDTLANAVEVDGYLNHILVRTETKTFTFGRNNQGQLGVSTSEVTDSSSPIELTNYSEHISTGLYHSMIVINDEVWGIGYNAHGELGDTTLTSSDTLKRSQFLETDIQLGAIEDITAAYYHSMVLDNNGVVWVTGNNSWGQLGDGTLLQKSRFEPLTTIDTHIIDIESHYLSSYAVDINGDVWSWGENDSYQLGDGTNIRRNSPVKIEFPEKIRKISAGDAFAIALSENNNIYVWGSGADGKLGLNWSSDYLEPSMSFSLVPEVTVEDGGIAEVNYTLLTTANENSVEVNVYNGNSAKNITYSLYLDDMLVSSKIEQNVDNVIFEGLTSNMIYNVKVDVLKNNYETLSMEEMICTSVDAPELSVDNDLSINLTVNDNNPSDTTYQVICGDKYVNSIGELVDYPSTVVLDNKTLSIIDFDANRTYGIKIRAISKYGLESAWSVPKYAEFTQNLPSGPIDFAGVVDSRFIELKWETNTANEDPYAVGYELEVDGEVIDLKYTREYTHDNLMPNTNHSYRVRSYNKAGYSEWSELMMLRTKIEIPGEASEVDIYEESNCVTLSWKYDPNVLEYSIKFEELVDGNPDIEPARDFIIDGITNNYYKMYGLNPETTYSITINSINSLGATVGTNEHIFTTYLLDTPKVKNIECDSNELVYSWQAIEDADYYVYGLYEIGANGVLSEVSIDSTEKLNIHFTTDSTLTDTQDIDYEYIEIKKNTSYQFLVQAHSANGTSQYSYSVISKTPAIKPRNVSYIFGVAQDRKVELYWEALEYDIADQDYVVVTSYDVLINAELDEYGNIISGILIENGIEDGDYQTYLQDHMMPFTTYNYRVRACSSNSVGDWSELIEVTTLPGLPIVPTGIKIDTVGNVTTITWDDMPGSTSYEVMDCKGENSEVYTLTDNIFEIGNVELGVPKVYQLRAINDLGVGEWSGFIVNNSMRLQSSYGEEVDLNLTGSQILDFEPYILNVYYNPDVLKVRDLCGKTPIFETEAGLINLDDGSIEITQASDGHITFTVYKEIELGYSWEGIINNIIFEGNISGGTTLDYTVFIDPQLKLKNVGPSQEVEASQIAEPTPEVAPDAPTASGTCGADITWTLTDGHLVLNGTGIMSNYGSSNNSPWYEYRDTITSVTVGEGIVQLGSQSIKDSSNLTSVSLPSTLTHIGGNAFMSCSSLTTIVIPNSVIDIGNYAFSGSGLTSANYLGTYAEWQLVAIGNVNEELTSCISGEDF